MHPSPPEARAHNARDLLLRADRAPASEPSKNTIRKHSQREDSMTMLTAAYVKCWGPEERRYGRAPGRETTQMESRQRSSELLPSDTCDALVKASNEWRWEADFPKITMRSATILVPKVMRATQCVKLRLNAGSPLDAEVVGGAGCSTRSRNFTLPNVASFFFAARPVEEIRLGQVSCVRNCPHHADCLRVHQSRRLFLRKRE